GIWRSAALSRIATSRGGTAVRTARGLGRLRHGRTAGQPVSPPVRDQPGPLVCLDLNGALAEDQESAALWLYSADGSPDPDLLARTDGADEPDAVEAVVPSNARAVRDPQQRIDQVVEQRQQMKALDEARRIPAGIQRVRVLIGVDSLVEERQLAGVDGVPGSKK